MEVGESKSPERGARAALCCHGCAASTGGVGCFKTHLKTCWVMCLTGLFNSKNDATSYVWGMALYGSYGHFCHLWLDWRDLSIWQKFWVCYKYWASIIIAKGNKRLISINYLLSESLTDNVPRLLSRWTRQIIVYFTCMPKSFPKISANVLLNPLL